MKSETKGNLLLWIVLATFVLIIGGRMKLPDAGIAIAHTKNTLDEYPLYLKDDAIIQLPVMFTLNRDLVSDETDMYGYCLSLTNRDVECYTMKGRFLGVGNVELYSDGNLSTVKTINKAPAQYQQVMTNAFLRVWG